MRMHVCHTPTRGNDAHTFRENFNEPIHVPRGSFLDFVLNGVREMEQGEQESSFGSLTDQ
jgi:hypothetical protein